MSTACLVGAELEHALDGAAVRPVDQLVEVDERLGGFEVALRERAHRHANHLLGPRAHLLEPGHESPLAREPGSELGQLGDGHAVVGHPLEVQVHAQDREHEAKVDRDRRLPGEQRLHTLLDREVAPVDVVVERDHLVGELDVLALERVHRAAERAEDERALLLHGRLEARELLLEGEPHPNRPVT